jgi:protein TonB
MQFSHTNYGSGSKFTKFALVAGLHLAIAVLFIHGLDTRKISLPSLTEQVLVVLEPERMEPPPPPPQPPQPMQQLAPPEVVVPKVEVEVAPAPDPAPLQATTTPDPAPFPATPFEAAPDTAPSTPASTPSASTGQMRTAVLADAKACALPDYPARAVREGVSGTTMLALLVGPDGRVSSARVERSSGSRDLDKAAVNALSLCRFKPATHNGVPEAAWAQLAYVWTLD